MIPQVLLIIFAQVSPVELYNAGNELYAQRNYQKSIEDYEQSLVKIINKNLFYNLGNAYFKSGRIGKALIQYRRAWLIDPRDEDIKHNLLFARSYRIDKSQSIPNPFAAAVADTFHFFSLNEASIFAAFMFFAGSLLTALFLISRNKVFLWGACAAYILFIFFFITLQVWQAEMSTEHGVITMAEVSGYSGPGEEHKEILVLHDGTEVRIRGARGGYFLVQLPGGMGGWVKAEAVERVFGVKSSHLTL